MWKDFPGSEHLGYVSDSMSHRSVPGGLKDSVALTPWTDAPRPGSLDPAPAPPAISASSVSREAPSSRTWSQNICIFGLLFPFCHPRSPSSPSAQPLKYLQNPTTSPHPICLLVGPSSPHLGLFQSPPQRGSRLLLSHLTIPSPPSSPNFRNRN